MNINASPYNLSKRRSGAETGWMHCACLSASLLCHTSFHLLGPCFPLSSSPHTHWYICTFSCANAIYKLFILFCVWIYTIPQTFYFRFCCAPVFTPFLFAKAPWRHALCFPSNFWTLMLDSFSLLLYLMKKTYWIESLFSHSFMQSVKKKNLQVCFRVVIQT